MFYKVKSSYCYTPIVRLFPVTVALPENQYKYFELSFTQKMSRLKTEESVMKCDYTLIDIN